MPMLTTPHRHNGGSFKLKGSPEEKTLIQRYRRQLNAQEDRLAWLRNEAGQLSGSRRGKNLKAC